jgi:shikimate dehydrogenase
VAASPAARAAVLGRPIAHSLSPVLHRAAYADLGLDWSYTAIECGAEDLAAVLAARPDWAGFSCTMPLKRVALELAAEVAPMAVAVGAANTLLPLPDGRWRADNTDVAGIVATLRAAGSASGAATVLGAGGTAQAAVAAFAELGLSRCAVLVRDPDRTAELRAGAERVGVALDIGPLTVDASALAADLVVSTLPAGAADGLVDWPWRPGQTLLDVLYEPWPTRLAGAASAAGASVVGGGPVLLHQAAAQVELMTGRPAPLAAMQAALAGAAPHLLRRPTP